jgi:transposase
MVKDSGGKSWTVGVDLGDKRSRVCVLDSEGKILDEGSVVTSKAGFEHRFKTMQSSRVVLETGTHANWVHDLVKQFGHEVIVANARKVRAISANERKSDEADARMLARLGRMDVALLEPVSVRPEAARQDLTLLRARAALVSARTEIVNSVRGLSKALGHKLTKCSAASLHRHGVDPLLQVAIEPMLRMLEQLTKTIRGYDREIVRLSRARYPQTKLLRQVKGVGPISALYFVLVVGDTARFEDARDVGAYFGLVPRRDQSGGHDPQLRIDKTGDRMARTLMVQCSHHILGRFGRDSDLRRFGLKLAERGGKSAKKRAVVATARKLSVLLFSLLRSGEVYEPLRNSEKAG